jgi:hypothetical protein
VTELFADFEINREPRWQMLARLIAGSLVLHMMFVAAAVYVPSVRSALNIATMFSGADYVDEDYTKTSIGDRATMVELSHEKFQYPEGYFSTASSEPDMFGAQIIEEANAVPPPPPPMPKMPTPTPTPTPLPTPSASPTPQPSPSPGAVTPNPGGTVAGANDKLSDEEKEKTLSKVAEVSGVQRPQTINKRPFTELLAKYKTLKDKGELDLSSSIEMVIVGDLKPDGKLDKVEVIQKMGDPRLTQVAKDFIAALSDSGVLNFLKDPKNPTLPPDRLTLTVKLDETDIAVNVYSELNSEERAREMASGYNTLLSVGALVRKGKDEEVIYKNTKVSATGKQIIVNFTLPRATAGEMLKKQLPPAS